MAGDVRVREAVEEDILAISQIFRVSYGADYPYQDFFNDTWLKRSVFSDDIVMLVAEDVDDGSLLGTASIVTDVGAHTDLLGEFGRLAVIPQARGRGIGHKLMDGRVEHARHRLHIGVVENRAVHPFSQKISQKHGFTPVGFLPGKHLFGIRENIAMFWHPFNDALSLRKNHPHIVPEAYALAEHSMRAADLPLDVIVDEEAPPYPGSEGWHIDTLDDATRPALLRIERGRVRNREVFGPMRLQYGFFKLEARHATYLVARQRRPDGSPGPIGAAVGYIYDEFERAMRVFEVIVRDEAAIRPALGALTERARRDWGVEYIEIDVNADAPRMQRTLIELGFVPSAYVPAMAFHEVERLDIVKMSRLFPRPALERLSLIDEMQPFAIEVLGALERQQIGPRLIEALPDLELFDGLTPEQAERLASACDVVEFEASQALWRHGEPADALFILIEGEVALRQGGHRLGALGAGEVLGEVAALTGAPHSVDVLATTDLVAARLDRANLRRIARQRPDIGLVMYRNLASGLSDRLRQTNAQLVSDASEPS